MRTAARTNPAWSVTGSTVTTRSCARSWRVGTAVLAASPGGLLAGAGSVAPPNGSTIAVPLYSRGAVIGVLVAVRRLGRDGFPAR